MKTPPFDNMQNWEDRYRNGDTPWDKGYAAPPLKDFLSHKKMLGKIFVPGCGEGHDVRILAQQGAEVVGLDWAASAIERAESFPKVGKESYVKGDLFNLSPHFKNAFDWVFEHTCFCAIPLIQRAEYVRVVYEVLKDSGFLFGIFFLNPDLKGDEGPPFPVRKEELDAFFSPCFKLHEEIVPFSSYPGREGRELACLFQKKH